MKRRLITKILGVFLALVTVAAIPLNAEAAGKEVYISELYVVYGDQLGRFKGDGNYRICETPLYSGTETQTKTYLVIKTTTDPNEAITDIRALRMNAGYSFEEYAKYLSDMKQVSEKMAGNMMTAINEMKKLYGDGKNVPMQVQAALALLNCFYDDDVTDADGKPMKIGDLFLSDKLTQTHLNTIVLESNADILALMNRALAFAASRDEDGRTFLDKIADDGFATDVLTDGNVKLEAYSEQAATLYLGVESIRADVDAYLNSDKKYEDFATEEERNAYLESLARKDYGMCTTQAELEAYDPEKFGNSLSSWLNGYEYTELFGKTAAVDFDGNSVTLLDLYKDAETYDEQALTQTFEMYSYAMTPGMRAMTDLGFSDLVSISKMTPAEYIKSIEDLKNDPDEDIKKIANEGLSVYFEVDRDIFKDGMVAMTSKAIRANNNGDQTWANTQKKLQKEAAYKVRNQWILIGTGSLFVASTVAYSVYCAWLTGNMYIERSFSQVVDCSFFETFFGCAFRRYASGNNGSKLSLVFQETLKGGGVRNLPRTAASAVKGGVMFSMVVISLAMLIASVVLYLVDKEKVEPHNAVYKEIPAKICDHQEVEGADNKKEHKYIYYNGVKNPDAGRIPKESLYAETATKEKSKKLPQNLGGVMDIYNWELKENRQWVCLYTTKDERAGYPILADSLQLKTKSGESGLVYVDQFDETSGGSYNLGDPYKLSMKKENNLYIGYRMSESFERSETPGEKFIKALKKRSGIGTMLSGGGWVAAGIGLAVGVGGGILADRTVIKKKPSGGKEDTQ